MINFASLKKPATLAAIIFYSCINAEQPLGIIGGRDLSSPQPPYTALISFSGIATPINTGLSNGQINSVAINASGQGLIGGKDTSGDQPPYAAIVSPSGIATPLVTGLVAGIINSVAINTSSQGIIGGQDSSGPSEFPPYAAFVSSSGIVTPINTGLSSGIIFNVAINTSGQGLIGGKDTSGDQPPYAAIVSPSGIATPINIGLSTGRILGVAINASGQGLIGGSDTATNSAYAAIVSPSGIATPINTGVSAAHINSVAINTSGQGLIGGEVNTGPAYAALVSPSGIATPINTSLSDGTIFSVAINSFGQGLIGGEDHTSATPPYAAIVSPSGIATPINIGLSNGIIFSVAINDLGQGVIGGQDSTGTGPAYAAIVSPSGIATPINIGIANGLIKSVAILPLLAHIPIESLSGNNQILANYINTNAPQDAFYFVPALFDGTLAEALESAAPTRNAISLYTASNNMFYLTTGLSNHLRNHSMQNRRDTRRAITMVDSIPEVWESEELTASINMQKKKQNNCVKEMFCAEKNSTIWFETLGALAYQKAQNQTPGFNPTTGGAILAYDGKTSEHTRVGAGAAYLYTYVHEKQGAGHSNINQEDLFVYASWENKQFYVDGSLLGGVFQISQVRKIHMTGFDFKSTSHPDGWQLVPHVEFGYKYQPHSQQDIDFTLNPFVMVDWANAWQGSYKEKGSGPFNAGQKSHYSSLLRTEASLRLYETLFFDSWNLIFQEKAGYVNVHSFGTGKVNAFLVGSPGTFTVTTLTSDQNLGVGEFAMVFAPHNARYPTGTIFYQGEFGSKYQSHQVALELAWSF
jgi:hypothetical protein